MNAFSRYPALPSAMRVRLNARTYDTGTAVASPLYLQYGIVEFLGNSGNFSDSLYGLYKQAIIHNARITLRCVNMGTEPIILACAILPSSWTASTPTLSELLDRPGCVRKTVGPTSGMSNASISASTSAKAVLGKDFLLARFAQNIAQASSSTPIDPDEPVWTVAVSAFNALTAISYRLEVELEYGTEFYSLDSS